jgi:hypothetical protein
MKEINSFLLSLSFHFTKVFFSLFFIAVVFLATTIDASAQPDIHVSLTNIQFFPTTVGMNDARILKIYNLGDANLEVIEPMSITDNKNFSLDYNNVNNSPCGSTEPTIIPDASCEVKIIFSPSSVGEHTAELTIRSNDPDKQQTIVSFLGEGTAPADIEVSPTTINFGSVAVGETSSKKEIYIQNTGGNSLSPFFNLSDWTNFGIDEYGGSNPCGLGSVVPPGSECTIWVWFEPTSEGIFIATLTINSNDPDEPEVLVTLNGNNPMPDIKANGLDGPITISTSDTFSATVALQAGDFSSINCDWWCAAQTQWDWYYYDYASNQWLEGLRVTHMGPCADIPTTEVLNMTLPEGAFTFYFGVDDNMNGSVDGSLYYDSVNVTVEP